MEIKEVVKKFISDNEIEWQQVDKGVQRKIMAFNQNLMMVKVRFEKGGVGALHKHHHSQITHIASGIFEIEIENEKQILKSGDAYYINALHGAICIEEGVLIDVFNPMRDDFITK